VQRPDFERLCDLADVKGLRIGITVASKKRNLGPEQFRDLEAIVVLGEQPIPRRAYPVARIHRSIDAAARRLLEAIR
jgi:hypothetical protein